MTEFISRKYGNDGYEVIIKTDNHEHYKASEEFARKLIDHEKPMTNGDWIRNMTDEEFVEFIGSDSLCSRLQLETPWCDDHAICEGCMTTWMKQLAEDNDGK